MRLACCAVEHDAECRNARERSALKASLRGVGCGAPVCRVADPEEWAAGPAVLNLAVLSPVVLNPAVLKPAELNLELQACRVLARPTAVRKDIRIPRRIRSTEAVRLRRRVRMARRMTASATIRMQPEPILPILPPASAAIRLRPDRISEPPRVRLPLHPPTVQPAKARFQPAGVGRVKAGS